MHECLKSVIAETLFPLSSETLCEKTVLFPFYTIEIYVLVIGSVYTENDY